MWAYYAYPHSIEESSYRPGKSNTRRLASCSRVIYLCCAEYCELRSSLVMSSVLAIAFARIPGLIDG
jgi:hypothetical protein